jgi:hypothetical protein
MDGGISPSQGLYLYKEQHKHRINAHGHSCLEWDSNPRSKCSKGQKTVHALDCAANVIGAIKRTHYKTVKAATAKVCYQNAGNVHSLNTAEVHPLYKRWYVVCWVGKFTQDEPCINMSEFPTALWILEVCSKRNQTNFLCWRNGYVTNRRRGNLFPWNRLLRRSELYGKIIFKRILKENGGKICGEFFWLRIGSRSPVVKEWKFGFHKNAGNFLAIWVTISVSKRTLLHTVIFSELSSWTFVF